MIYLTDEQAQQIDEALDESYAELSADSHRDGPRCLLLTTLETAIATIRAARAQEPLSTNLDGLPANLAEQEPVEYLMEVTCKKCGATESGVLKFKDIAQAVNQEPIGYTNREWIDWILNDQRPAHASTDALIYKTNTTWSPVALYAAPVRTKDLTDDEIYEVCKDVPFVVIGPDYDLAIARAVIALYREKNK